MKLLLAAVLLAASLGGCAIVPYDYGYRGDRQSYRGYDRDNRYYRGYDRSDGYSYRRYGYQDHGQ